MNERKKQTKRTNYLRRMPSIHFNIKFNSSISLFRNSNNYVNQKNIKNKNHQKHQQLQSKISKISKHQNRNKTSKIKKKKKLLFLHATGLSIPFNAPVTIVPPSSKTNSKVKFLFWAQANPCCAPVPPISSSMLFIYVYLCYFFIIFHIFFY